MLKRHPSALLLGVQLLGVVLYPAMENTQAGRAVFGAFGIVVLALALWVVNRSPLLNWVAWILALPAVVLSIIAALSGQSGLLAIAHLLEGALYFYTALGLIAYMLRDHKVTDDELFAAGATFTLLAWSFAFAFSVCQQFYPGSFIAAADAEDPRSWMELLYLSFSILSGVGLSDVAPVLAQARALVMLEQFAGVMYIALVVSRLIGLATSRALLRRDRMDKAQQSSGQEPDSKARRNE
jgi:uncharacterized membrane protein